MSLESLLARLQSEAVTPKPIEDVPWGGDTGPSFAPFVVTLATPNGTCEVTVPRDQHDPEAVAAMVEQCRALPVEKDPRRWRGAEITAPDGRAIKATTPNGWGQSAWQCLARGYFPKGYVVRALESVDLDVRAVDVEQGAITQEGADLKEYFEARAGILQYDAGLPKPDAELEAARIVTAYARNKRYSWLSLREALAGRPDLLTEMPDKAGIVDCLPLGLAMVHVLKGRVLHQGEFVGEQEARRDSLDG
jgi:hypothetical protein